MSDDKSKESKFKEIEGATKALANLFEFALFAFVVTHEGLKL